MNAVSVNLLETIKELQALNSLKDSVLGGGTSLALRYNHRESVDIDLFFSGIIGFEGYKKIEAEILELYKGSIIGLDYPCNIADNIPLIDIFRQLEQKQKRYSGENYKSIFALDNEVSPVNSPHLLLKFDPEMGINYERPDHSARHFKIVNGVSWLGPKVIGAEKSVNYLMN